MQGVLWWCIPPYPLGLQYHLRNAHEALAFTNSTWAKLLLNISETVSGPRNSCKWTISQTCYSCMNNTLSGTGNQSCNQNFKGSYQPKLWTEWKITMTKLTHLQPYKQWLEVRPFELSWTTSWLQAAFSLWVGHLSEAANSQVCCTQKIAAKCHQWSLGWYSCCSRINPFTCWEDAKVSNMNSSLNSRRIFYRYTPRTYPFRSVCMQVRMCCSNCAMNVALGLSTLDF